MNETVKGALLTFGVMIAGLVVLKFVANAGIPMLSDAAKYVRD